MASRFIAIPVPARPRLNADRIILAVAVAFAILSVLVTLQTFTPGAPGSGIDRMESARPVNGLAHAAGR